MSATRPRVFVSDEGDRSAGTTVVMLHGLGGTTSMFQPQAEALAAEHRVVRLDLPGSGRSPLAGPPSVTTWADDVLAVLDDLGVTSAVVVAHSLGTLVAAEIASRRPSLVRSLVLVGPVRAQPEQARAATRSRAATVRDGGMAPVVDGVLGMAVSETARREQPVVTAFVRESLLAQDPEGYAASCEALAAALDPPWPALTMPVWLVSADADRLAAPALVDAIAAQLPHARRTTVPDAGHWISVERPQAVTDAVTEAVLHART